MELGTIALTAETDDGLAADQAFREEGFEAEQGEERDLRSLSDGSSLKERIDGGETLGNIASELDMIVLGEVPFGRNDIVEGTPPEFIREIFASEQDQGVVVPDDGSVLIAMVTEIIPATLDDQQRVGAIGDRRSVEYRWSSSPTKTHSPVAMNAVKIRWFIPALSRTSTRR